MSWKRKVIRNMIKISGISSCRCSNIMLRRRKGISPRTILVRNSSRTSSQTPTKASDSTTLAMDYSFLHHDRRHQRCINRLPVAEKISMKTSLKSFSTNLTSNSSNHSEIHGSVDVIPEDIAEIVQVSLIRYAFCFDEQTIYCC